MRLLLLLLATTGLVADDFEINEDYRVNFVMLDIVATTRKGEPITDLKMTDFVVTEDKKKVTIDYFEILNLRGEEVKTTQAVPFASEQAQPHITNLGRGGTQYVLVLDLQGTKTSGIAKTFDQLRTFLSELSFTDKLSLQLYSLEHGFLLEDFTDQPRLALDALNSFEERYRDPTHGKGTMFYSGRARMDQTNLSLEDLETSFQQCLNAYGVSSGLTGRSGRADSARCINDELAVFLDNLNLRTEAMIKDLEDLPYQFLDRPGSKAIIMFSPGFSLGATQAASNLANYYKQKGRPRSARGTGPSNEIQPFIPIRGKNFQKPFRRVLHACTRNRVSFYTFNIFNVMMSQRRSLSVAHDSKIPSRTITNAYGNFQAEMNEGLHNLADGSGGRFYNGNNLVNALRQVVDENRFIYVIGYRGAESTGKMKYHKIKVKTKRKKVKLTYRKGYFG